MRSFWMFRSNLKHLEYYHKYTELEEFEKKCHDFYLILPLWMVKNNKCDEAVIWRLTKKDRPDITFQIDNRKFIQRWVRSFDECLKYKSPDVSFFRGGFPEYCNVTKRNPSHFGYKLYLGAGPRLYAKYGGKYDAYLLEDKGDFRNGYKCLPFYKTASPEVYHPYEELNPSQEIFDVCWPFLYTHNRRKGEQEFIRAIGKSKFLKGLKIAHLGDKPNVLKQLCSKHGVSNIKFLGKVGYHEINYFLNHSKLGLCMSNKVDGCPRVMTETLMSGTPLILNRHTRLLDYYKKNGVVIVDEGNIAKKIEWALENLSDLERQVRYAIKNSISVDRVCQKNLAVWTHR